MTAGVFYLVRHAEAERSSAGSDVARRLTAEGRSRFGALAAALAPALRLSRVLTSPLVRGRETADLLAAACGGRVEEREALSSGRCGGTQILELARSAGAGVALVGHNPEMAEAVKLAAGRDEKVPPGAVAAVEVGADGYRLLWVRIP
jgi:phosphohistidine phosphatase